jgi:F-type H+-transporting ATPase subunit a
VSSPAFVLFDSASPAVRSAADTAHVAAEHGAGESGGFNFLQLLHHIQDSRELETPFGALHLPSLPPIHIGGVTIDLSITKHVLFLIVAALALSAMVFVAVRQNRKRAVPRGVGNVLEFLVVFVRDEIAVSSMGQAGLRYVPFLLTTFCYILIMNVLGLVPYGSTATGNLAVTAGLAFVAFVMIQVSAIRSQGFGRYVAHLTGGVPWLLWPIMIPIEFIGLFTKPFALCMRLFANMTGGHTVLLSLMGFIFLARSYLFSPVPVVFSLGINLLELLVALIQAYIFTMLTALFMGLGMAQGEHGGQHEH